MNIKGNDLADKAAKKGTKIQRIAAESYISLAFIKRKIKESALTEQNTIQHDSNKKGKYYSQFNYKPKQKIKEKIVKDDLAIKFNLALTDFDK